jgi:hypothetical protein
LIDYEKIPDPTPDPDWAKPDPARLLQKIRDLNQTGTPEQKKALQQEQAQLQQRQMLELRGWWLERMAHGPRPFQEKMVLFWHGHFATSVEKVRDAYYMWRQNELFRRLATGNWLQLAHRGGQRPGDAHLARPGAKPARRIRMKISRARSWNCFRSAKGHYTEHDIARGRARADRLVAGPFQSKIHLPPGLARQRRQDLPWPHGQSRRRRRDRANRRATAGRAVHHGEIVELFRRAAAAGQIERPRSPPFSARTETISSRFCASCSAARNFTATTSSATRSKARCNGWSAACGCSNATCRRRIASWGMLRQLGQDLFAPPNVKGWDGGITWITTNTLLTRYNDAEPRWCKALAAADRR